MIYKDEVLSIAGIQYVIEYNKSYWAVETRLMNLEDTVKRTDGHQRDIALTKIRKVIEETPGLLLIE